MADQTPWNTASSEPRSITFTPAYQAFSWAPMPFESRVEVARHAMLELYLDNPTPESAHLLMTFERTVQALRERERRLKASETKDGNGDA